METNGWNVMNEVSNYLLTSDKKHFLNIVVQKKTIKNKPTHVTVLNATDVEMLLILCT